MECRMPLNYLSFPVLPSTGNWEIEAYSLVEIYPTLIKTTIRKQFAYKRVICYLTFYLRYLTGISPDYVNTPAHHVVFCILQQDTFL